MTDGPYLLGIDFGTGGARVGIFDPEGAPLVFSEREYKLEHPRPGWAEQEPDEWWSCLVAAVKGAMEESSISPEAIVGISVDAMSSSDAGRHRAGIYSDIPAAAENMVHTADTIEPDPGRHEEYRFYVDRYMEAYPQMKELMHKTERHVAGRTPAAGE